MSAAPKHVWVHPRDRTVLGVKLSDLPHEVDRELLHSLASEPLTAPVWPVLQAVGATDAQIDAVLRLPGPRCQAQDGYHPARHWHWRAKGDTQFWLRSPAAIGGAGPGPVRAQAAVHPGAGRAAQPGADPGRAPGAGPGICRAGPAHQRAEPVPGQEPDADDERETSATVAAGWGYWHDESIEDDIDHRDRR